MSIDKKHLHRIINYEVYSKYCFYYKNNDIILIRGHPLPYKFEVRLAEY